MQTMYRSLFKLLVAAGKPVGGVRPRRLYDWLGRLAHKEAQFDWFKNRWGAHLFLSPHFHIDRNILVFGCYDEDLHLALESLLKPGMVCMDVGAHFGEVAFHMAQKVGPSGEVYAFEPEPSLYERLIKHAERNERKMRVCTVPMALSDRSGSATLYAASEDADNQGLGSLMNGRPQLRRQVTVQTTTLDAFVKQQKIERIDLIKVDIQGAEIRFLRGGHETFRRMKPDLLIEFSPDDLKASGKNSRDLFEVLETYGYQLFRMKQGEIGARIDGRTIKPGFSAPNVYCTQKKQTPVQGE